MSAVLLMSVALGLFAYAGMLSLPAYSPRRQMVRRLGPRRRDQTGHLSPWLWLRARQRSTLLSRAYPDLLAHLVTQTQAGASTFQAFASSPPVLREPLRSEVEDLIADMQVAPFPAALERFAHRCAIPEIRAFAQTVIHQQALGIALPEVLVAEEAKVLAITRQSVRRQIRASAVVTVSVTIILLINGLLIHFIPLLMDVLAKRKPGS